eukprot:CAMPEP_0172202166 /NCGR_PEP_ID=MMETSP1050-20130122/30471_1 /TAXON_ID=233186 /ORGANISM="Cryptomonas curvata, Strain CCAP979/52" /LENGTH=61 /DNA_ID=CAMNT_0012880027 /DNA_START=9 /DNA_END=191 /DNA_ORIENTATION=+
MDASSTLDDINAFERRLELKTLQEGVKHKAASMDLSRGVVTEAVATGMQAYRALFPVRFSP